MKTKIITALLSLGTFMTGFAFTFNLPAAAPERGYENAFAESAVTPVFTVKSENGVLTAYDTDGAILTECRAPDGLPEDELAELENGITFGSREEMLVFLEDFEE